MEYDEGLGLENEGNIPELPAAADAGYQFRSRTPDAPPTPAANSPEGGTAPAEPDESLSDKDNPNRFQYWQSRYDRLRAQIEPVMDYIPLARAVAMRPDIQQMLVGGPANPQDASPEPTGLRPPEMPSRPPNYDHTAAFTDPEAPSFKYRESMEQYQQQLADFLIKRDEQRERAAAATLDAIRQEKEAQNNISMLRSNAILAGVPEQEVDSFMEMFSNPDPAVMLKQMADMWRMRNGGARSDSPSPVTQRAQELLRARLGERPPTALAGAPGTGAPPPSDPQKGFSSSLKAAVKRHNL